MDSSLEKLAADLLEEASKRGAYTTSVENIISSLVEAPVRGVPRYDNPEKMLRAVMSARTSKFIKPSTRLWHWTNIKNRPSIEAQGLLPHLGTSGEREDRKTPKVFFGYGRPNTFLAPPWNLRGDSVVGHIMKNPGPDSKIKMLKKGYPVRAFMEDDWLVDLYRTRAGRLMDAGLIPEEEIARQLTGQSLFRELKLDEAVPKKLLKRSGPHSYRVLKQAEIEAMRSKTKFPKPKELLKMFEKAKIKGLGPLMMVGLLASLFASSMGED